MVGQRLAEVAAILRKQGKEQGGGFQMARNFEGAEEIKHISCVLDEQAIAGIFYKAGTEQVTSLGVSFSHLGRMTGRADQIWVSVRKITFHPDGSYSLQFEKPTPPKPAAERPKSVAPTFNGNNQVPANPIRGDGRY